MPKKPVVEQDVMGEDELRRRVDAIAWWHSIALPYGITTPGKPHCTKMLDDVGMLLPEDMTGMTVLDLGAWDGMYSFFCEKRGAEVCAVDLWGGHVNRDYAVGFDLAREVLGSKVEKCPGDVMNSPWGDRKFNVVLFLGMLYHMRHPLLALELAHKACLDFILVETHVVLFNEGSPAAMFYPGTELGGDCSNWWGLNPECVLALMESAGFRNCASISVEPAGYAPLAGRMFALGEV